MEGDVVAASPRIEKSDQRLSSSDPFVGRRRLSSTFFASLPLDRTSKHVNFFQGFGEKVLNWRKIRQLKRREEKFRSQLQLMNDVRDGSVIEESLRRRSTISTKVVPLSSLLDEEGEKYARSRYILLADSMSRIFLEVLFLCCFVSGLIVTPILVCFPYATSNDSSKRFFHSMSMFLDVAFSSYIYCSLVHFATPEYLMRCDFATVYCLSRWFLLDLLCALPLVSLGIPANARTLVIVGSCLRFCSIFRVFKMLNFIHHWADLRWHIAQGTGLRMGSLLLKILFATYFLAAGFYWVSFHGMAEEATGVPVDIDAANLNLTNPFQFKRESTATDLLTAIYFAMQTVYTVGYGDVVPSNVYQVRFVWLCIISATVIHALVIANMTSLLKNLDVTSAHFKQKTTVIQKYMQDRQISLENQRKVTEYFDFLWERQRGNLEAHIMGELPLFLRDKICKGKRAALLNISLLQGRDLAFIDALVAALEPQILNFSEFLVLRKSPVDALYLLSDGKLEVMSEGFGDGTGEYTEEPTRVLTRLGTVRNKLSRASSYIRSTFSGLSEFKRSKIVEEVVPGSKGYIGEELLFSIMQVHSYSVRAAQICELQRLDGETYRLVMGIYSTSYSKKPIVLKSKKEDDTLYHHFPTETTLLGSPATYQFSSGKKLGKRGSSVSSAEIILDAGRVTSTVDIAADQLEKQTIRAKIQMPASDGVVERGRGKRRAALDATHAPSTNTHANIVPRIPTFVNIDYLQDLGEVRTLTTDPAILASIQKWITRCRDRESIRSGNAVLHREQTKKRGIFASSKIGSFNSFRFGGGSSFQSALSSNSEMLPGQTLRSIGKTQSTMRNLNQFGKRAVRKLNTAMTNLSGALEHRRNRKIWLVLLVLAHLYSCITPPLTYAAADDETFGRFLWVFDLWFDFFLFTSVLILPRHTGTTLESPLKRLTVTEILHSRGILNCLFYLVLAILSLLSYISLLQEDTDKRRIIRFPYVLLLYPLVTEEIYRCGSSFVWFEKLGTLQVVAVQITTTVIITTHWATCVWIRLQYEATAPLSESYFLSFYWSLVTLTTVGFGDNTPSSDGGRIFAIGVIVVGATLYAGFVSILAAITRNSEESSHSVEYFDDCCRHYLSQKHLPRKLVSDAHSYLEYAAANYGRIEEEQLLRTVFPQSLEDVIKREVLGERYCHHSPLFKGLPDSFFTHVIREMKKHVFPPGYLISSGFDAKTHTKPAESYDRGLTRGLLYLEVGEAEIMSATGKAIGKIGAGKSFSWISLFEPETQELKLKAIEFCEVWYLSQNGLMFALKQFDPTQLTRAEAAEVVRNETKRRRKSGKDMVDWRIDDDKSKEELTAEVRRTLFERAKAASQNTGNIAKNLKNAKLNKLIMANTPDTREKHDKHVILPGTRVEQLWNVSMLMACCYNIIFASYRLGMMYGKATEQSLAYFLFDVLSDALFVADIFLRLYCFAVEKNGVVETKRRRFFRLYYKSHNMAYDVLSSIPLSLLAVIIVGNSGLTINTYSALRFNSFVRFYRAGFWVVSVKAMIPLQENITTFVILLCFILGFAHVVGCLFFGLARHNLTSGVYETWATNSTEYALLELDRTVNGTRFYVPKGDTYQRSLYWAVASLTTVGYGDYAPVAGSEIFFTVCLLLTGGFLYALILNNLEEIIAHSDISSILFQRKLDNFNVYTKYRDLPNDLAHRISEYYNTQWLRQKGVEESWIQERLPLPLRRWVRFELLGERPIKNFPLFSEWNLEEDLLDMLRPVTIPQATVLFMDGELIYQCYFVTAGVVEYVSCDGSQVYTSFRGGDIFGQVEFFFNEQTRCIARTKDITDMCVLNRVEFDLYLQEHPKLAAKFRTRIVELEAEIRKKNGLEAFTRNMNKAKVNKFFAVEDNEQRNGMCNGDNLIPPSNTWRRTWDVLLFCIAVYLLMALPYRAVFLQTATISTTYILNVYDGSGFVVADVLSDVVLWIDAVLNALVFTCVTKQGVTLWTRREVKRHYLKTRLVLDVITLTPWEYLFRFDVLQGPEMFSIEGYGQSPASIAICRMQRLIIVGRLMSLFNSIQTFMEERGTVMSSGYRQISRMGFTGIICVHLVACVKCAVSYRYKELLGDAFTPEDAYTYCLYWALYTISTVGYGNILVDSPVVAITCMLAGAFLCDAGVTATLSNILSNQDSKTSDSKRKRISLVKYMRTHYIAPDITKEVLNYVDYCSRAFKNLDEHKILSELNLPAVFRKEITGHVALRAIPRLGLHPMFCGFSRGLLQTLSLMLVPKVFPAGHELLRVSDSASPAAKTSRQTVVLQRAKTSTDSVKLPRAFHAIHDATDSADIVETSNLEFLRTNRLGDPGLSLFHAGFANISHARYAVDENEEENIYFLVSGSVLIHQGSKSKVIRRGLVSKSSGIDTAKVVTHSECFVLGINQYMILAQFSKVVGGAFSSFSEVLMDPDGFKAVKTYLEKEKNSNYVSDISFYRDCMLYEADPNTDTANNILDTYIRTKEDVKLGLAEEMIAELLKGLISGVADPFKASKEVVYLRLEHVVKPRFFASIYFLDLVNVKQGSTSGDEGLPQQNCVAEPEELDEEEDEAIPGIEEIKHEPITRLTQTAVDIFPTLQALQAETRVRGSIFEKGEAPISREQYLAELASNKHLASVGIVPLIEHDEEAAEDYTGETVVKEESIGEIEVSTKAKESVEETSRPSPESKNAVTTPSPTTLMDQPNADKETTAEKS